MKTFVGYRKFLLCLVVIVGTSILLFLSRLTGDNYADVVKWTIGLYMGGNVGSAAAQKLNLSIGSKGDTSGS